MAVARGRGVNPTLIHPRMRRSGALPMDAALEISPRAPTIDSTTSHKFQERTLNETTAPVITLYTSAVCGYCVAAKNFLRSKGLEWTEVRIDTDPAEREKMVALARRTSVPQIFVGDVHVGGYDDLVALHRSGGFEPLLAGKGA